MRAAEFCADEMPRDIVITIQKTLFTAATCHHHLHCLSTRHAYLLFVTSWSDAHHAQHARHHHAPFYTLTMPSFCLRAPPRHIMTLIILRHYHDARVIVTLRTLRY